MLEEVLNQTGMAIIAYDSFGRLLRANAPTLALLQAENFAPARATALDFLRLVTRMEESQVRDVLRNALLDHSPTSMSVKLASQGDRQFLLRVYPLSERRRGQPSLEPFNLSGLVCELIETTSLSTLASLKGVVADRLGVELRDHLAAIQISAALLEADRFTATDRQSVLDAIHYKAKACVQVISECQKYLGRGVDAYAIDCFPVDALELLRQACSAVSQKAAERRVTLNIRQPRLMDQVLASTSELTALFSTILDLLLRDAAESTALSIEVEDTSQTTEFCFHNCGFGIPNERLQEFLSSSEIPASEEFQSLRGAAVSVRNWGGSLEISSAVGKGYRITLQLRLFKLAALSSSRRS